MTLRRFACLLAFVIALLGIVRDESNAQSDRAADAAAIRAHIGSIFQAFIDGDEQKIFETHSNDWRGFLEESRKPIKGIDDYMRANGIDWPRPANAPKSEPYFPKGTTYFMNDFDVQFYSQDLAVASFFGGFEGMINGNKVKLRQAAREAVWKAWFTNDKATLERLVPEDVIAIDGGNASPESFSDRAKIFAEAQSFADSGAKLVKLEFPKTEIQVYGNTVIVYTTYLVETEANGKRNTQRGRATEMFVRRGDDLVNVGWHLNNN